MSLSLVEGRHDDVGRKRSSASAGPRDPSPDADPGVHRVAGDRRVRARDRLIRERDRHIREHTEQHANRLLHQDRKSTRLNSSHGYISYAVFCLKKKKKKKTSEYIKQQYIIKIQIKNRNTRD